MVNLRIPAAVLAGIVLLGTTSPVRADELIELTLTAGSTTASATYDYTTGKLTVNSGKGFVIAGANYLTFSGPVGDFSVFDQFGVINTAGMAALTQIGNAAMTNTGSSTETLHIEVSATGFTDPTTASLLVTDAVSGSVKHGTMTGTAQGFADTSNTLGGTSFASTRLAFGPIAGGDSFSAKGYTGGFSPNGNPYSLTFVESFTLSAKGIITPTGGNVDPVVPEPASMMAAFTAMPFLGLGAWWRRRRTRHL